MDADGHGIVVGMIGFSMALMGFVLSLVAPVVQSVYPRFHQQFPAIILDQQGRHRGRRRIVPPTVRSASGQGSPSDRRPSPSPSESADSVATTKSSTTSFATNATSMLSDCKPSEESGRKEELDVTQKDAKSSVPATNNIPRSPRACIARVARIGIKAKPKRAGSASTALSTSSAEVADARLPIASERVADSPASSTLNLAPSSSSVLDVNNVSGPLTPTFEGSIELLPKAKERPRSLNRAKTFFNLGRSSSKRRQEDTTHSPPSGPLPIRAATLDDSHSSGTKVKPVPSATQQYPFPSDHITREASGSMNAGGGRRDKNGLILNGVEPEVEPPKSITVPCLGKLKGKKTSSSSLPSSTSGTVKSQPFENVQKKGVDEETSTRRSRPFCSRSRAERPASLRVQPSDAHEPSQPTHRISKKQSRKSISPLRRTRPYEAPYFFPMPTSPDAIDYARRTRSEYVRAYSGLSQERTNATNSHADGKDSTSKCNSEKTEIVTPGRDLKTAPAHRVGFHFPLHFHRSHTRSASLTSPTSPSRSPIDEAEADELGFVRSSQDPRMRNAKDVPSPGIARSATLPGNGWPSGEEPSFPLRPVLSPKGVSR